LLALTAATGAYAHSVTNKIYVANNSSANVTVIDATPASFTQHSTSATIVRRRWRHQLNDRRQPPQERFFKAFLAPPRSAP